MSWSCSSKASVRFQTSCMQMMGLRARLLFGPIGTQPEHKLSNQEHSPVRWVRSEITFEGGVLDRGGTVFSCDVEDA
jgi:hypothetical protein